MSVYEHKPGVWRAQVYDRRVGRNVGVGAILGGSSLFGSKREAKRAREAARAEIDRLITLEDSPITVGEWRDLWVSDRLWERPKPSTNIHNRERVRAFCDEHRDVPLRDVGDLVVARWLAGGDRNGQVPALRAMWNDAASAKAGRLVAANPWAGLRLERSRGNRDKQPPSEEMVRALVDAARELTSPWFAGWLEVAAYTGMRPGELDALSWDDVDLGQRRIRVHRQWNATARCFTLPKNGLARWAIVTPNAERVLRELPQDGDSGFVFVSKRRTHFTPSSRSSPWGKTRAAAGYRASLYLATRHFCGWYMTNVLLLPSEDVAIALGHTDGGELVRRLYGHRDNDLALRRVARAFDEAAQVVELADFRPQTAHGSGEMPC